MVEKGEERGVGKDREESEGEARKAEWEGREVVTGRKEEMEGG